MATGKRKRSPEVIEDVLIQRIFLVTLTSADNKQVMYLEKMAAENLRVGKSLLLNRDLMDEVLLVGKLSGQFSGESLFQYLTGCYGRAFEEGKKIITNMQDVDLQSSLVNGVIEPAKKSVVNYCRIYLHNPDMFPHSEKISAGSALLPIIFSAVSENNTFEHEIRKVNDSPLGNFVQPLKALKMLVRFPNGGKASVNHPLWLPKGEAVNGRYSFICDCFFMTARVLNLGLLKVMAEYRDLKKLLSDSRHALYLLQRRSKKQPPSNFLQEEISRLSKIIELLSIANSSYESHLFEDYNIQHALSFYRLMIVWLVDSVGGFKMPLPSSCPMEFGCMPEQFVDDAMELLIFVSEIIPEKLDPILLNDFTNLIIMFAASPNHVRNPFLRAKMVTVLNFFPKRTDSNSTVFSPFHDHQLSLGQYLVESILRFYVDIELTGSDTRYLEKFMLRHETTHLLKYLREEPRHHDAWTKFAQKEEKGVYLNFLNFLITDSIYLLDEGFNKIRELKEMELKETNDRSDEFLSQENKVREFVKLALEDISMLAFTSEHITAPFLLPQMVDRIANMLNYFLVQLVGPKRNSLNLKSSEKYGFEPRILLKNIISIYVHIARVDTEYTFAAAICKYGRSYNERLFTEVVNIPSLGEEMIELGEFVNLSAKVKLAAVEEMDVETALGEIPDEFLDPKQCTLMRDPVTLPSSNATVDRLVIERHLLIDTIDPFNRSHLTKDMLIPDVQLKSRIDEFIKSRTQQ
ncbi:probable ubiquitin conjugation factor E4 [Papaver somniferum]|uniref:probable ubiquitin conjugation factor E4 n=1 Tax=Papaver somniferum TaxID=3469 RepID=UPI000E6F6F2C|nr:probable ubiquitin conjugation factor E4 [Papaver somniferum]